MNFTVKYRGADGALKTEVLDAASRADAISQLKARGITPTTVAEGGKRAPATASTSSSPCPAWLKGAVAGLVVVLAAAAAWFFLMPAEKPQPKPEPAPKPKVEKPKPAPRPRVEKPKPVVTNQVVEKIPEPPKKKGKYADRLRPGDPGWDPKDHPTVLVYTNKPPENPEGGIAHRNATEQVLDWIFSCQIGDPPGLCPALPAVELADMEKILSEGVVAKEGDSADTLEHKEIIAAAKRELQEYVAKGGDPQKFIAFYHSQLMNYHQQYLDAQNMVMKAARESPEIAADLVKKVNENLAKKGIKPVMISKKMRERLGIPQEEEASPTAKPEK